MKAETISCAQGFGDVLKRVREHRHLTAEQLSSASRVPLSRILRFENGTTDPTLREIFLLAGALRAKPSSLIEGVELVVYGALKCTPPRNGAERAADKSMETPVE